MTSPTTEAIEAIAVAMFYQQVGLKPPYPLWDDADAVEKDNCRNDAQLAYDAMAPFIAAQALAPIFALHQPVTVYAYDSVNGVFMVDDDGEQIPMTSLCSECTPEDVLEDVGDSEFNEGDGVSWPCATVDAATFEVTP